MIIRSALRGILPSHGGARFISSTSTPLSDVYESMRKSLKEEEQSSSKNYEQFAAVRDLADQSTIRARKAQIVLETKERMNQVHKLQDFEKFQSRRWREGDVYSPHDLSHEEMKKWKVPQKARDDVFDVLGINPLHEYKVSNPPLGILNFLNFLLASASSWQRQTRMKADS